MATLVARNEDQAAPAGGPAQTVRIAPRASIMLRQRNRMLALMLASAAAVMFVAIVTLAVLFHLAEAHHALAGF